MSVPEDPDKASDPLTREDVEFLHWWGIPTLFRCPADEDPRNCDIALIGVPHSTGNGTTWRDQHLGPRAVRDQSPGYRRKHPPLEVRSLGELQDQ